MKQFWKEFFHRGLIACGFGPLVLMIVYLIVHYQCGVEMLALHDVCIGIVSLSVLAFISGGMNAVYQLERLPLMIAILIHGAVLYFGYFVTYLVNGWLEWGTAPILVFSVIFVVGYLIIWAIIDVTVKRNTKKMNEILTKKRLAEANK